MRGEIKGVKVRELFGVMIRSFLVVYGKKWGYIEWF